MFLKEKMVVSRGAACHHFIVVSLLVIFQLIILSVK